MTNNKRAAAHNDTTRHLTGCDWLYSDQYWSEKEATLMAYDLGQTGQQFENKINRSNIVHQGKKMKETVGKIKRIL